MQNRYFIFFSTQGVTCIPLPPCPSGIDFRSRTEYIPGTNCKIALESEPELPPCPTGIDFRSQTEYIPGNNCKILPFCSEDTNSEEINLRSQSEEIPGMY